VNFITVVNILKELWLEEIIPRLLAVQKRRGTDRRSVLQFSGWRQPSPAESGGSFIL